MLTGSAGAKGAVAHEADPDGINYSDQETNVGSISLGRWHHQLSTWCQRLEVLENWTLPKIQFSEARVSLGEWIMLPTRAMKI